MFAHAVYPTPLGPVTLIADGETLTGLSFCPTGNMDTEDTIDSIEILDKSRCWLDLYFAGRQPDFLPPIRLVGTPFQQRVWQALLDIPYGETITYADLARRIGCRSAQAVGQAVGRNPIAIINPCHRVVGSDGSMTGYAYGIERKKYLLALESKSPASPQSQPHGSAVVRWLS